MYFFLIFLKIGINFFLINIYNIYIIKGKCIEGKVKKKKKK
jgi:hypothetical protein